MTTKLAFFARNLHRYLSDELVLFLGLGGLIFALFSYFDEPDKTLISLSAQTREALIENQKSLVGREISASEITRLEEEYIAREILFNEAVERQLFLYDARAKEALIERLQFELSGSLPSSNQGDLIDFYSDNLSLYTSEPEFSFKHVFFTEKLDNPAGILAELVSGEPVTGDQFWQGDIFPDYGASAIRSLFDQEFLAALGGADLQRWFGPLETSSGSHFVLLRAKRQPQLIPFMEISDQVKNDYLAAEQKKTLNLQLDQLKKKYDIRIKN